MRITFFCCKKTLDETPDNGFVFDPMSLNNVVRMLFIDSVKNIQFENDQALIIAQLKTGWKCVNGFLEIPMEDGFIKTIDGYYKNWEMAHDS